MAPVVKTLPAKAGFTGSTPTLGRSSEVENGNPLHYSYLENSRDRGVWWAIVYGISKSQTGLSMHPHMTILVWPHRVRHSCAWYKGGASDVSLKSTQRRQSFPLPHFPLTLNYSPLNPQCRAPSPIHLHLLQASYTNKSTFCLSVCFLLFLSHWDTENLTIIKSRNQVCDLSWKTMSFGQAEVPASWVQVPNWILAKFESWHMSSNSGTRVQVTIWGELFHKCEFNCKKII